MKAELIDRMGTDLTVCNSARVSFDKTSEWEKIGYNPGWVTNEKGEIEDKMFIEPRGIAYSSVVEKRLSDKDQKLINYLAKHDHWTPFSHVMITMRETVPIFVARQRFKHVVGFTYNEISRRYVSDEPSFFTPSAWRKAAENKKQGSGDETINIPTMDGPWGFPYDYDSVIHVCQRFYEHMIEQGVAPEQARMVLPQSVYTSYYTTGSLAAWARAYKLRSDPHSQMEIQELAKQWYNIIGNIEELKYSWKALTS